MTPRAGEGRIGPETYPPFRHPLYSLPIRAPERGCKRAAGAREVGWGTGRRAPGSLVRRPVPDTGDIAASAPALRGRCKGRGAFAGGVAEFWRWAAGRRRTSPKFPPRSATGGGRASKAAPPRERETKIQVAG